ncbi:hypothetical protein EWB00_001900 [Schistosoma japonicum]|uniref:Uncharacterized protein n=1 Tax=Schistosoma japonicum TaxID=6182 RepID=A0A4Z2DE52_SCHJA|nr:hypothetical protein EWB00_001900 [Schistosoma japonicum]
MGAAYTKVLNNLLIVDHGEATSDSNLKKAKVACVLSSTQKPTKPTAYWKYFELKNIKEESRCSNLKAGSRFIHECRCSRENIAVVLRFRLALWSKCLDGNRIYEFTIAKVWKKNERNIDLQTPLALISL